MSKTLEEKDYLLAAAMLNCDVSIIKAVAEVESAGSGFDKQGRLKIRFEGHIFRRLTRRKFDESNPQVSYPYAVQRDKPHGYTAFNEAFALDDEAAMEATSWGKFQPMGEYCEECGFDEVGEMVEAFRTGEAAQLQAFVAMVKARGLDDELRREDWAGFARNYNGSNYRVNRYDTKMAQAKARHDNKSVSDDESEDARANKGKTVEPAPQVPEVPQVEVKGNAQAVVEAAQPTPAHLTPTEIKAVPLPEPVGVGDKLKGDAKSILALLTGQTALEMLNKAMGWNLPAVLLTRIFWFIVVASVAWVLYRYFNARQEKAMRQQTLELQMSINADKSKHDVVLVQS